MRFGLGFPTCREGTAYPVPYVRPGDFVPLARLAERLGFYSLWGNDHISTPAVIRATLPEPPNFYEPLITYASLASATERLRFMLSIIILPQREPVLLAKQAATLDVLTGGRVMLGVGVGGYRDELDSIRPEFRDANRVTLFEEGVRALRLLFEERRATFEGEYIRFYDVELAPKPLQRPFPIYISARTGAGLKRVVTLGDGWVIGDPPPGGVFPAVAKLHSTARALGRDPAAIPIHSQIWLCSGRDEAEADDKLRRSQYFRRRVAHRPQQSADQHAASFREGHLFGTPDQVIRKIRDYEEHGIHHLNVIFVNDTFEELLEDMQMFAERVMPAFDAPIET